MYQVLQVMIAMTPDSEESFKEELKLIAESVHYASPENIRLHLERVVELFVKKFPDHPNQFNDWQRKVYNEWMNVQPAQN